MINPKASAAALGSLVGSTLGHVCHGFLFGAGLILVAVVAKALFHVGLLG